MKSLRIKLAAISFGLTCTVVLAGCSGNSANVAACNKANTKLKESRISVSEISSQNDQILGLSRLAAIFSVLSTDLSNLADSSSGDVRDELNSSAIAAHNVADAVTALDQNTISVEMSKLKRIFADNGSLDKACQSVGASPFSTGW